MPGFTHPGLRATTQYASPQQPVPAPAVPTMPQAPAVVPSTVPSTATSAEEEDRIQLERIRRLRQELEREQRKEEQKSEDRDTWPCTQCTLRNSLTINACQACDHPRPGFSQSSQRPVPQPRTVSAVPSPQVTRPAPVPERWSCSGCGTQNSMAANLCKACESPMPGSVQPTTPAVSASRQAPTTWNCPTCTFGNPLSGAKCQMCETARPPGLAPTVTAQPIPAAPQTWTCGTCTFANSMNSPRCSMCQGAPPPGTIITSAATLPRPASAGTSGSRPVRVLTPQEIAVYRATGQLPPGNAPAPRGVPVTLPPRAQPTIDEDSDDSDVEPPWQKDADAPTCNKCNSVFSLMNRRHHCRLCGFIYCGNCAANRFKTKTGKDERVCIDCFRARSSTPRR